MSGQEFDEASFPEFLYLEAFRDVRDAVAAGGFRNGYEHYILYGKAEIENHRRPSPFTGGRLDMLRSVLPPADPDAPIPSSPPPQLHTASPDEIPYTPPPAPALAYPDEAALFDEELYLALNPDVAADVARGKLKSGRAHWRKQGRVETDHGARPSITEDRWYAGMAPVAPPVPRGIDKFDVETYWLLYPDVLKALGPDPDAARRHWIEHGRLEGRTGPGVAPYEDWQVRPHEVLKKPFGFNVFGPFAATSGLGTASRGLLRALRATGVPIELHPYDVSRAKPRITPAERERKPAYRVNLFLANADQIARLTALYPPGTFDDAYNIAVWAWEMAAFRQDWYTAFGPVDEIWTNSDFEMASIGAVSPVPLTKIRLPVEIAWSDPERGRDTFGIPRDRFVFMVAFDVGSTSARKNPRMVVEAFRAAFPGRENVFLVIKFHSTAVEPAITRQLTQALRGADNVLVISDLLTESDMALLRAACDCFVSAHRSEGFGLNIAEFMALGKPVIATAYSGNLEFFDATVGYPIAHGMTEVTAQTGPYLPFAVWADPDQASLIEQFRAVYENQAEAWKRGAAGAKRIREELSAERVGQEMRRRIHLAGLAAGLPPYLAWIGKTRSLTGPTPVAALTPRQREAVLALGTTRPVISLIVPVYNVAPAWLASCIASVQAQSYPFWELCLCDDASTDEGTRAVLDALQGSDPRIRIRRLTKNLGISGASNMAAEMSTGEFIAMLDNDDMLEPDALLEVARALFTDPEIDVIYTDEDKIDEQGRLIDTYFKPDFSPEHLESVMYVLHMMVVRKKLFFDTGGFRPDYDGAQDYDLMLRLSRETRRIHHIRRALYHWRAVEGSAAAVVDAKPYALQAGFRALADHTRERHGEHAWVEQGLLPGTFRVRRKILGQPRVSLIILTNNGSLDLPGRGRFQMVDNLVHSILRRTAYPNYEVLVVDNGKLTPKQLTHFKDLGVRVENYGGAVVPFNYAAKANFALRMCRTEHLVMLNDDMEVFREDWLTSLLELSQEPEIGAVGGRLLHADGSIQHVGCVIGICGGSAHVYHSYPGEFIGYNGFTHLIRNYAAVTGACLATRKSVLAQIGSFDESFAVDFNDTDLCLRMLDAGYRVAYTPFCELFHFEGASAQRWRQNADEHRRFVTRWARYMENDPYFNPNFARDRFDFVVG
ncbi:MAG TPA: glycosyltransferase [Acetobacteraceae bacterium]|nr:glycosyltransferase [Acetobacteraceae bacterium]